MSLTLLQNVNFGSKRANVTGSTGVGYTVLDTAGVIVTPRTTAGVYQAAPGIYAANVAYPDDFHGQILWDCPAFTGSSGLILSQSFATEQYNVEANDPKVASIYDISFGRWKIDKATNQMLFYKSDNVTLVARFNLFDDNGNPVFDGVFERVKV
jgi:hypothetical protein